MKKSKTDYVITVLGILLLVVGVYFVKSGKDTQGIMRALPYVCIGLGCGIFGHGMGDIISRKAIQTDPKLENSLKFKKMTKETLQFHKKLRPKPMI